MLRHRLRLRRWLRRPRRERAPADPSTVQRAKIEHEQRRIDALAACARAGDLSAAALLTDIAEGEVEMARMRMARVALDELIACRASRA